MQSESIPAEVAAKMQRLIDLTALLERLNNKLIYGAQPTTKEYETLPGRPQWEVKDLIPGRRIRADIFIPPCVIVEMDGYRFHKSLDAFKKDRKRQNLLTANGFLVFRTFAKEVFDEEERRALVEMIATTVEKGLQF